MSFISLRTHSHWVVAFAFRSADLEHASSNHGLLLSSQPFVILEALQRVSWLEKARITATALRLTPSPLRLIMAETLEQRGFSHSYLSFRAMNVSVLCMKQFQLHEKCPSIPYVSGRLKKVAIQHDNCSCCCSSWKQRERERERVSVTHRSFLSRSNTIHVSCISLWDHVHLLWSSVSAASCCSLVFMT
jgi:hypothetical protein